MKQVSHIVFHCRIIKCANHNTVSPWSYKKGFTGDHISSRWDRECQTKWSVESWLLSSRSCFFLMTISLIHCLQIHLPQMELPKFQYLLQENGLLHLVSEPARSTITDHQMTFCHLLISSELQKFPFELITPYLLMSLTIAVWVKNSPQRKLCVFSEIIQISNMCVTKMIQ